MFGNRKAMTRTMAALWVFAVAVAAAVLLVVFAF